MELKQGCLHLEEDKYFFSYTANPILYSALWAKSFTVLGANVGISEFAYAAKTILNVEILLADDELQPDLMRRVHTDTKRIELIPVFNQKCTKKLLSEYYSDILNGTRRALRDGFIYTSNNDEQYSNGFYYASHADDVLEGGERVSMASYGLNHYQHLHKAAFLGCANLDKTTIGHWRKYCELNGWVWQELEEKRQAALNYEKVYQFVSRCSVRVRGNNNKQVYIVPDVACAEYLKQHYFHDAVIKPEMIKTERKKRNTSKGDDKFNLVKSLVDQGLKRKDIVEKTGFKIDTVKFYLKQIKKAA